jgi:phage gp46-like protein
MDFALTIDNQAGIADMTFEQATGGNLANNVYLSLMVKRGSFFQNPDFGSRLHLLQREKNTPRTEALAIEYCKEALAWLIETGRVSKFEYFTERDKAQVLERLKIIVVATKADGDTVSFATFVEVV